ncbi:MAG: 4'-phosphopantetheinyl transferase superfamily protein [Spirochaetaceae bacterium]|nr:4'-phosphopantetheinyl transferase superfamily protein [Spirochaetaceae bacterium]
MKNNRPFRVGLSLLPELAANGSGAHAAQHEEGLRVLGLLDGAQAAALEKEPSGRPRFADAHADFSISHSRRMAAVSFSRGRTGCDIQYAHPQKNHDGLARRLFHPEELRYLDEASGARERSLRFCRLWTLKECFLKANGLSVFAMKKTPAFLLREDDARLSAAGGNIFFCRPAEGDFPYPRLEFHLYECGGDEAYILAAAREETETPPQAPEIIWFSEKTLPFTHTAELCAAVL